MALAITLALCFLAWGPLCSAIYGSSHTISPEPWLSWECARPSCWQYVILRSSSSPAWLEWWARATWHRWASSKWPWDFGFCSKDYDWGDINESGSNVSASSALSARAGRRLLRGQPDPLCPQRRVRQGLSQPAALADALEGLSCVAGGHRG